jgi:hypothetical protein
VRLLLDECVPARLRKALPSHQVSTVPEEGWSGGKNGKLLVLAAGKFDALVMIDKNLPYQQSITSLPISVFVLDAPSNQLPNLLPLVPVLEVVLQAVILALIFFAHGDLDRSVLMEHVPPPPDRGDGLWNDQPSKASQVPR